MNLDFLIFNWLNNFAGKYAFLDGLAFFCSEYLQFLVLAVFAVFSLKNWKKYFPEVICAISSVFLSRIVFTETIRHFFPKDRPFAAGQINAILEHSASPSFPSGHAAFFFALAAAVYFFNKKLGAFFFISAFLISLARVFGGIHWPSDILAGGLMGIFSGWLIYRIFRKFFQQKTP